MGKTSFSIRIKRKVLQLLRITNRPVVTLYHGYGNERQIVVYGHVFTMSPLPRKKYNRNIWTNIFALLRLFMVRTPQSAALELIMADTTLSGKIQDDGFFRFEWKPETPPVTGWHTVKVRLLSLNGKKIKGEVSGDGFVYVPDVHLFGIISDIDDTFLISHSANLRKRLFVLLTENAQTRKPFDGVVNHYQRLASGGRGPNEKNPFFYVSSSEWNLYPYILEFSRVNHLPQGVYLLNQLKTISQVWKTGQNNHSTKFMRIVRILEAYPDQAFVLLGDDSQQDPVIYASVVQHFSSRIKAVYLRNVYHKNREEVYASIDSIRNAGVECCHFTHSSEAVKHSIDIGLIGGAVYT